MAVLVAEVVAALAPTDRGVVRERFASRPDGHSRRSEGVAAAMLGAIGAGLMMMEG